MFRIFSNLRLPSKAEVFRKIFTVLNIFLTIKDFWATLRLPWKTKFYPEKQTLRLPRKTEFFKPSPRLVRHWMSFWVYIYCNLKTEKRALEKGLMRKICTVQKFRSWGRRYSILLSQYVASSNLKHKDMFLNAYANVLLQRVPRGRNTRFIKAEEWIFSIANQTLLTSAKGKIVCMKGPVSSNTL